MAADAEQAYLFSHAALRDAAYQLWLPSDRGRLHAVALDVLEETSGRGEKHAYELAGHAHDALQGRDAEHDADMVAKLRARELEYLGTAIAEAQRGFQRLRAIELFRRMLASPALKQADAMDAHGQLAQELQATGRLDEARGHFERELAMGRALESGGHIARSLLGLGRIEGARGSKENAERLILESIEAAVNSDELAIQCNARNWLAGLYEDTGRAHLTEGLFRHTIALAQAAGDKGSYLSALGNLANHLRHVGRLDESAAAMKEVQAGFEKLGRTTDVCVALNNMGRTLYLLGRIHEADAAFSSAIEMLKPHGQVFSLAFALGNAALVWLERGKLDQAHDALERAIAICEETASLMYSAAYKASQAGVELLMGRRERAQELIEESRSDFIHSGSEQYITDYCDIVRLRIAADAATDAAQLALRKTAKVSALAPRASWLPVMRQILKGMQDSLARQRTGDLELQRNISKGKALLAEIETAVRENRPARVFHGYLPSELSAELRAALAIAGSSIADALR